MSHGNWHEMNAKAGTQRTLTAASDTAAKRAAAKTDKVFMMDSGGRDQRNSGSAAGDEILA